MNQSAKPAQRTNNAAALEFARFHEGYLSRYIQLADAKAGTALVVVAATLGYLLSLDKFVAALSFHGSGSTGWAAIAASALLASAGAMAFLAISPRGSARGSSLIYWSDVAALSAADYADAIRQASAADIARERLGHAHAIAVICARKYFWLRLSLIAGALGLVAALICRVAI